LQVRHFGGGKPSRESVANGALPKHLAEENGGGQVATLPVMVAAVRTVLNPGGVVCERKPTSLTDGHNIRTKQPSELVLRGGERVLHRVEIGKDRTARYSRAELLTQATAQV
jgi:hypothetical protein